MTITKRYLVSGECFESSVSFEVPKKFDHF